MKPETLFCMPVRPRLIRIDVRNVEKVDAYFTISWKGCIDGRHRQRFTVRCQHWAELMEKLGEAPDLVAAVHRWAINTNPPYRCHVWPTLALTW